MAPFTPFFCEELYQNLKRVLPEEGQGSVHWCSFPTASASEVLLYASDLQGFRKSIHAASILQIL